VSCFLQGLVDFQV